jgi:hypothetical protein
MEQIKSFIIELVHVRENRSMRHLEEREKLLDVTEREYELARQFLGDVHKIGLLPEEEERLVRHIGATMQRLALYSSRGLLRGVDEETWGVDREP